MARILYCWETQTLADVPGRARALARDLAARGHELALMVSDTNAAGRELRGSGLAYYQAPVPVMALRYTRLRNFADSLSATGFLDLDALRRLQRGWRQWFSLLRPDVLVVDHAPVAQLAACLNGMPCLRLGDGFDLPPEASPLPVLQPWIAQPPAQQQHDEAAILRNVNALLQEAGLKEHTHLHEFYHSVPALLATLQSFDPFEPRRLARHIGWLQAPPGAAEESGPIDEHWPKGAQRRIFLHLRSSVLAAPVQKALATRRTAIAAVLPGASRESLPDLVPGVCRAATSNREGMPWLAGANLAVFDGDPAVLAACVRAAVPMICIPNQVEGFYLAGSIAREKLGLAMGTVAGNFHGRLRSGARALLDTPACSERIAQFARETTQVVGASAAETVADEIDALLARGRLEGRMPERGKPEHGQP